MNHQPSIEDRQFRHAFEALTLPPGELRHRGHLRIAYVYLCESSVDEAHQRLRRSLLAFLERHEAPIEKFHVTITQAWLLAVSHFMHRAGHSASFDELVSRFPEILNSKIMMTHYSEQVLAADEARLRFVEPDLEPIPRYD